MVDALFGRSSDLSELGFQRLSSRIVDLQSALQLGGKILLNFVAFIGRRRQQRPEFYVDLRQFAETLSNMFLFELRWAFTGCLSAAISSRSLF